MVWVRSQAALQQVVDQAPRAKWYYSDGFDAYQWLWYHFGRYETSEGKSDTYSVEGDNAELRHYLARLARKSRCFSRCPYALECALRLRRRGVADRSGARRRVSGLFWHPRNALPGLFKLEGHGAVSHE